SGERLDPPDARRDARFADDLEQTDISGHLCMCAPAQFHADFRNRNDPNLLLVFLSEKRERPFGDSFTHVHDAGLYRQVSETALIDLLFDLLDFAVSQRSKMRVIEPKTVRCDERTRLLDVRTQRFTQNRVEDVRSGVIGGDTSPAFLVDLRLHFVVDAQLSEIELDFMHDDAPDRRISIEDARDAAGRSERAHVSYLTAGFCIERRLIEDNFGRRSTTFDG